MLDGASAVKYTCTGDPASMVHPLSNSIVRPSIIAVPAPSVPAVPLWMHDPETM